MAGDLTLMRYNAQCNSFPGKATYVLCHVKICQILALPVIPGKVVLMSGSHSEVSYLVTAGTASLYGSFGIETALRPTGTDGQSLQDLGFAGVVNLWQGNCTTGDDGHQNCTMACQNSTDLFRSIYTIANCATLAYVVIPSKEGSELGNLQDSSVESLAVNVSDPGLIDATSFMQNVFQCFSAACKINNIVTSCPSTLSWNQSSNLQDPQTLTDTLDELREFCEGVVATPNADIAGPGVSQIHTCVDTYVCFLMVSLNREKFD